jgi:hypothetical protein
VPLWIINSRSTLAVPDTMQMELSLGDDRRENPDAARFKGFLKSHPHYLEQLITEARATVEKFGSWSIHHAIEQVRFRHGKGPTRDYAPALARKISDLHPELGMKCKTRPSKFAK